MLVTKNNTKPVIGFYDLTGCQGCLLSFIFNEEELLDIAQHVDIRTFRFIKQNKDDKHFDIVFVEGLVANKNDLALIKELRAKTTTLIALGACACTGCVPAYRNFIDASRYASLVHDKLKEISDVPATPLHEHVKVDYSIPGCPPDKKQIYSFIKDILLGKTPQDYDKPVCFECRLNENRCLLDDCKMCLGPMTRGGCNSVCTNGNLECWGCRGPTPDANITLMTKLLEEKGFSREHVRQRLRTFAGMQMEQPSLKTIKPPKAKKQKRPDFRRGAAMTEEPVKTPVQKKAGKQVKKIKTMKKVKKSSKTVKTAAVKKKRSVKTILSKKGSVKRPKKKTLKMKAPKKVMKKTAGSKKSVKKKKSMKKPVKSGAVLKTAVKKQKKIKQNTKHKQNPVNKKVRTVVKKTVKKVVKKTAKKVVKEVPKKVKAVPKQESSGKQSNSIMNLLSGFKKK
ncbi:MAG: hypothetical protein V1729_01620 [Candidatus Woesearchaeota archaeon]